MYVPSINDVARHVWALARANGSPWVTLYADSDETATSWRALLEACPPLPAKVGVTLRWLPAIRPGSPEVQPVPAPHEKAHREARLSIPGGGRDPFTLS